MSNTPTYERWREVRLRLATERKALAEATAAYRRGEIVDVTGLAIKQSEVRALSALSRSLMKKSLEATQNKPR